MTMHLINGLTSLNTKKKSFNSLTKDQKQKLEVDWKNYNKKMKSQGLHHLQYSTFEEYYKSYVCGQKTNRKQDFVPLKPRQETYRRTTPQIPSRITSYETADQNIGVKKSPQQYTGTLIKGIATMHKSNAVPVLNQEQAIDLATMRRN